MGERGSIRQGLIPVVFLYAFDFSSPTAERAARRPLFPPEMHYLTTTRPKQRIDLLADLLQVLQPQKQNHHLFFILGLLHLLLHFDDHLVDGLGLERQHGALHGLTQLVLFRSQ